MPTSGVGSQRENDSNETLGERDAGPAGYAQLLDEHFEFVRMIVRGQGVLEGDEDAAQEIMVRFWQLDMLAQYDPDFLVGTDDGAVRTRFRAFLGRFAALHALHHRDKAVRAAKRRESMEDDAGRLRPEVAALMGGDDAYDDVEERDERAREIAKVVARVEAVDVPLEAVTTLRHTRGQGRSPARTLKACMAIVERGEPVTRRALGAELGVSDTAAGTFLLELRETVGAS